MEKKLPKKQNPPQLTKKTVDSGSKFPKIHRFFPEISQTLRRNMRPYIVFCFLSGFLLMIVIVVVWDIERNKHELEEMKTRYEALLKERMYWEEVVKTHSGFRDWYYQLAVLEYQLGNTNDARIYANKTIEIDPQFERGRELLEKLF